MDIPCFPGEKHTKKKKNSFVDDYPQKPVVVVLRDALMGCNVDFYVFVFGGNLELKQVKEDIPKCTRTFSPI